LNFIQAIKN